MPDLLLHSLTELREVLLPVVEAVRPRRIVEIGSESGGFTELLLGWAREHGAHLVTIDPAPADYVRQIAQRNAKSHTLVLDKSPGALAGIAPADLYVIDGDHNYYTVFAELESIHRQTGGRAVSILHDVGWPCARRDQYCDPLGLPPEHVHPYDFERGLTLGESGVVVGGFRGNGNWAPALVEGGARNGVLTAIEDFRSKQPGYQLAVVPAVFGVGVLYPDEHVAAGELAASLAPYHENAVLARLEENRLRNYLRVIALQDHIASLESAQKSALAELSSTVRSLEAQRDAQLEGRRGAEARIRELEALLREAEAREGRPLLGRVVDRLRGRG